MTRTSAWRRLRQLVEVVRVADRTGEAPREALERLLARRAVLKAAGVAAGATLLGGTFGRGLRAEEPASPKANGQKVVVVGAGISGLHCAHRLKEAGVDVAVYDAAQRIGGRNLSDRRTFAPQHCELGGELIDSAHTTMLALADELKIDLLDFQEDEPGLHEMIAFVDGKRLSMADLFDDFVPLARRIDDDWDSLDDPDADPTYDAPNGAAKLDGMTIAEWLDGAGASGPVRKFLETAYVAEYGLETDRSSSLNLLSMLVGHLEERAPNEKVWNCFGPSDERYHAADGNDHYSHRLADRVGRERIHLGEKLVRAKSLSDGRIELTFDRDGRSQAVAADRVVFAVPFTMLRNVDLAGVELSPAKRLAIAELGMGKNAKMMCGFEKRLWRASGTCGMVMSDLEFQCAWDTSRLQTGATGILTHFMGGDRATAFGAMRLADHRERFLADIDLVYPGAKAAATSAVVRYDWTRYPLTHGSYSAYLPGQWTTIRGAEREAAGPIHFCGEHTSLDHQGFMEGAAESGLRAAQEIGEALGMKIQMPNAVAVPAGS